MQTNVGALCRYGFSLYKVYGPHMAALYGSHAALEEVLPGAPNHYFVPREDPVYSFELGGVPHESTAGIVALPLYLSEIAGLPQTCPPADGCIKTHTFNCSIQSYMFCCIALSQVGDSAAPYVAGERFSHGHAVNL